MSNQNQEMLNKTEVNEICIVTKGDKQNNTISKPVITLIVFANALAVAVGAGIKENPQFLSEYIIENDEDLTVQYPFINLGVIEANDKNNGLINNTVSDEMTRLTKEIDNLERKVEILKNKLKNSLPIHTITYMIISGICGAAASVLLIVRFMLNIYIIDPYYLICALIIASGLFVTALVSLKDWKECLLNEEEER